MRYDPSDPFSEEQLRRRVHKGAELLDEHYVRWEDAINLETLNVEHTDRCVLGQIGHHPEFSNGKDYHQMLPIIFADWTGDALESAEAHGFDIEAGGKFWTEEYEALTREWSRVVKERKDTHA
jgi:hypothetical protein